MSNNNKRIETTCVQGGYTPGNGEPRQIPIIQSTTFKYDTSEDMGKLFDLEESGFFYTRLANPTSDAVQTMINRLYLIRKNSILVDGEYGTGNLIFKAIRDAGLLQKLKEELYNILSKELTFEHLVEDMRFYNAMMLVEDDG